MFVHHNGRPCHYPPHSSLSTVDLHVDRVIYRYHWSSTQVGYYAGICAVRNRSENERVAGMVTVLRDSPPGNFMVQSFSKQYPSIPLKPQIFWRTSPNKLI